MDDGVYRRPIEIQSLIQPRLEFSHLIPAYDKVWIVGLLGILERKFESLVEIWVYLGYGSAIYNLPSIDLEEVVVIQ